MYSVFPWLKRKKKKKINFSVSRQKIFQMITQELYLLFSCYPFDNYELQVSNSILNIVKNPLGLTLTAKSPPSTYCEQSRCANNKQDEEEQVCAINQRIEIVTSKKSWRCEGGGVCAERIKYIAKGFVFLGFVLFLHIQYCNCTTTYLSNCLLS